jgi:hypothetical protein
MSIEFIPRPKISHGRSKEFEVEIRERQSGDWRSRDRRQMAHPAAGPCQPFVAPALDVTHSAVNFDQEIP